MSKQAESQLSYAITKAANQRGHDVHKNHGSLYSGRGRPDIEGMQRGTAFHVAIEVKLPGKERTATRKQLAWLWRVQRKAINARVGIATSVDQALRIIEGNERQKIPTPAEVAAERNARKRRKKHAADLSIDPANIAR